jgi:LacI family transcriptional regulator
MLVVDDVAVAAALTFIQRHALEEINVSDVVLHVTLERRALERRFRRLVGRSLKTEITRQRLQRAKELLAETNLSCERIAHLCGFGSPSHFMDLFRRSGHDGRQSSAVSPQRIASEGARSRHALQSETAIDACHPLTHAVEPLDRDWQDSNTLCGSARIVIFPPVSSTIC